MVWFGLVTSRIIIIIIIIMLLFLSLFLSGASPEPTVIPTPQVTDCSASVLCVMFLVQLSFVLNLLNVFLAWIPKSSLNRLLLYGGSNYYRYDRTLHEPRSLYLYI
jgi:hypothetical protein